jgi:hypothetical protein
MSCDYCEIKLSSAISKFNNLYVFNLTITNSILKFTQSLALKQISNDGRCLNQRPAYSVFGILPQENLKN